MRRPEWPADCRADLRTDKHNITAPLGGTLTFQTYSNFLKIALQVEPRHADAAVRAGENSGRLELKVRRNRN